MKSDNSLLNLEKKLEIACSSERILSKFKLKPNMKTNELSEGKDILANLSNFVNKFKQSNDELLNNSELIKKMNIENKDNNGTKFIQMNLGLGIFDIEKKTMINLSNKEENSDLNPEGTMDDIMNIHKNNNSNDTNMENPYNENLSDEALLKFLLENETPKTFNKKRNRLKKIKKHNSFK